MEHPRELAKAIAEEVAKVIKPHLKEFVKMMSRAGPQSQARRNVVNMTMEKIASAVDGFAKAFASAYGIPDAIGIIDPIVDTNHKIYIMSYTLETGERVLFTVNVALSLQKPKSAIVDVYVPADETDELVYSYAIFPLHGWKDEETYSWEDIENLYREYMNVLHRMGLDEEDVDRGEDNNRRRRRRRR
ncbi:MAG: hypothetical protein ACK4SY_07110 [Pyrobaculum sp.]